MHWHSNASVSAAALLAGAGLVVLHLLAGTADPGEPSSLDDFAPVNTRTAIVSCREAAHMAYDVQWAAACQAHAAQSPPGAAEDHAECDLPYAHAAIINAWLNDAERRCTAEGPS